MKILKIAATATVMACAFSNPSLAQDMKSHHADMAKTESDTSASSQAFLKANEKMHQNMMMDYTGQADIDFVRGMIAHHQGAIDMAKVELAYGKDPVIRKLAENIIKAQETEITQMQDWLKAHQK